MSQGRLDIRLDEDRRRKLRDLAAERGVPVSDVVRQMIDTSYEAILAERRRRAAHHIGQLAVESVPDADELSRQLEEAHEPGGLD